MVPVEIESNDSWSFFPNMIEDRKIVIFDPLHSHVYNLSENAMTLEKVSQSEESHRQEVDPDKLINGPIVISQPGDVDE